MQEKLPLKWQTRKADSIPLAWQGKKGKKKTQQNNKPTTEKKEKWCCFQAIYMFISQENVTLYPFFQINFCVTCRIKRVERQELKHREIKDCKPACTEHMFVIYRRQGRGGIGVLLRQPLFSSLVCWLNLTRSPRGPLFQIFFSPPFRANKVLSWAGSLSCLTVRMLVVSCWGFGVVNMGPSQPAHGWMSFLVDHHRADGCLWPFCPEVGMQNMMGLWLWGREKRILGCSKQADIVWHLANIMVMLKLGFHTDCTHSILPSPTFFLSLANHMASYTLWRSLMVVNLYLENRHWAMGQPALKSAFWNAWLLLQWAAKPKLDYGRRRRVSKWVLSPEIPWQRRKI